MPHAARPSRPTLLVTLALFVVSLWLLAGVAFAQERRVLTFNEAVRIALEQNVELQKAANNVEAQATTVARERADFLPNLGLSAQPQRNLGLNFDQTAGQLVSQNSNSVNVNAGSQINVFNGFADVATLRQARLTLDASENTYDRTRQDVLFNVIQSYLQVLLDSEQVRIRLEDVEAQRQQLQQIQEFVQVGSRPISDLYQQQATVANSELLLLEQERALQLSKMRVVQVLELNPLVEYEFEAPSIEALSLAPQTFEVETMLRRAYERRSDLRAQELTIDAAEQGIRAARSGYYPSVAFNMGYGTRYTSNSPIDFNDQFNSNRNGGFGLQIDIPIFDRLATRSNVQRARIQQRNAELDLENLRQDVALEVRQAYLDYQTAIKRLDATEKQVQAAEQALAAEQERYNVGAATLVELTQARATYASAAANRAQAVFRFLFQDRVVEYQMGSIDPAQQLLP